MVMSAWCRRCHSSISRDQATEGSEHGERGGVEAGDHRVVGVPGPTPAAFGEQHHRHPQALDELEDSVLLAMVLLSLGAGEHGVVVGQDGARRASVHKSTPVHPSDPGHQAVGRGPLDQLVDRSPTSLGGNGQ